MAHVEGEIVINRSVEDVFDFVADQRNELQYNPEMVRSEMISDGPIGVGTQFRAESKSRGGILEMTIEFTTFDRPRKIAEVARLQSMDIRGMLTFDSVSEGTRMRWVWDLEPHGALKLMTPLVALMGRRQERAIWTGLKQLMEAQTTQELQA